jgi:lipopolysaccharide transport system permease protein
VKINYFDFLMYRAIAELRRDSANMYLGVLWWVLEPLLYMGVFYVVFGLGLKKGGMDFVLYLLCALVPWKWFDSTVRTSSGIILSSAGLMRQIYFPKWLLPGYIVVANVYKFLIVLSLFLLFLYFAGVQSSSCWIALPLLVFLQFAFICAISGLVSSLVPLIPDLRYAVQYGMTMLFFMSGIFFDVSELGEPVKSWLYLNPMLVFIESYRAILLNQTWPDWQLLENVGIATVLLLLVLYLLFKRMNHYYPRVVG